MNLYMNRKEITDNIREKLGIEKLNAMQRAMEKESSKHIVLLAPTGSGKTIGFALQLLRAVGKPCGKVQGVVIAPSRELVIQTAEVIRRIAVGLKVSAIYGGHSVVEEKATLSVAPDIVVATPGRLLDHMQRGRIDVATARALVLDEYDKSLELGFRDEMSRSRPRRNARRRALHARCLRQSRQTFHPRGSAACAAGPARDCVRQLPRCR